MSLNRYKSRFERQTRGAPANAITGVLILLAPGEDEYAEYNELIR